MIIEFKLYKKEDIIDLGKSDEFENNIYQYRDVQFVHLEHLGKYVACWTDEIRC